MATIIKQVVGIDCSKQTLDCSYGTLSSELKQQIQSSERFTNDLKGFKKLTQWTEKRQQKDLPLVFVVEATGVYHEALTNFLVENGWSISVVLPNRTSNFFRTTRIKTITDASSARMIAQFGLEKELSLWKKPEPIYRTLKQLTRERQQLVEERTVTKNQLHAEMHSANAYPPSIKRMKQRLKMLDQQIKDIEQETVTGVKTDPALKSKVDLICTIKGIGLLTAVTVIAETNGFDLIRNKKQLVSYAGLDIIEKQSGTSVRGAKRISRRGNRHIRKALYFPAFTSIKYNDHHKSHYAGLISKHGIKMKAAVSVQRKLLVLIYTIWKKNEPFDMDYHQKESGQQSLATPTRLDQVRH
jgi:transposase